MGSIIPTHCVDFPRVRSRGAGSSYAREPGGRDRGEGFLVARNIYVPAAASPRFIERTDTTYLEQTLAGRSPVRVGPPVVRVARGQRVLPRVEARALLALDGVVARGPVRVPDRGGVDAALHAVVGGVAARRVLMEKVRAAELRERDLVDAVATAFPRVDFFRRVIEDLVQVVPRRRRRARRGRQVTRRIPGALGRALVAVPANGRFRASRGDAAGASGGSLAATPRARAAAYCPRSTCPLDYPAPRMIHAASAAAPRLPRLTTLAPRTIHVAHSRRCRDFSV